MCIRDRHRVESEPGRSLPGQTLAEPVAPVDLFVDADDVEGGAGGRGGQADGAVEFADEHGCPDGVFIDPGLVGGHGDLTGGARALTLEESDVGASVVPGEEHPCLLYTSRCV